MWYYSLITLAVVSLNGYELPDLLFILVDSNDSKKKRFAGYIKTLFCSLVHKWVLLLFLLLVLRFSSFYWYVFRCFCFCDCASSVFLSVCSIILHCLSFLLLCLSFTLRVISFKPQFIFFESFLFFVSFLIFGLSFDNNNCHKKIIKIMYKTSKIRRKN